MPFAGYKDFDDCVAKNSDKSDPKAYCATIMRAVEETEKTYTPEEAGYVKSTTPRKCGTCEYFTKPNQCKKIPSIAVDDNLDCCNLWNPFDKKDGDIINIGMK
ncbi:MAG: hypothetical protein KGI08_10460, partial [Thaumarchaeota archaeon]|nr:hypothetical protein [Nitrososphaerota archaeon]